MPTKLPTDFCGLGMVCVGLVWHHRPQTRILRGFTGDLVRLGCPTLGVLGGERGIKNILKIKNIILKYHI
jgi:hypothetical protein